MGLNRYNFFFYNWYPDYNVMTKYPSITNLSYLNFQSLIGKIYKINRVYSLEFKLGGFFKYLIKAKQEYSSNRDTIFSFYATGDNLQTSNFLRDFSGKVLINRIQYTQSHKPFNTFIPGVAFECNLVGKVGAGKANFEKWRYKIGIYAQTDLRDVEGKAWNWFMPPQLKYPNAPSYIIRSGIQFGLSYHFNKR